MHHPARVTVNLGDLTRDIHTLTCPGGLLDQLEALLPEPVVDPTHGTRSRHKATPSPPWHAEAAYVWGEIHAGARDLEDELTYRITGHRRRGERGGSEGNTRSALDAIGRLVEGCDPDTASRVTRTVAGWVRAAREIRDIDETDRWDPVPRMRGHTPPECPYCTSFSLRMCRQRSEVRCFNPTCRDLDGNRPVARMEYGAVSGEGMLVFRDTTTVHFRHEPESTEGT